MNLVDIHESNSDSVKFKTSHSDSDLVMTYSDQNISMFWGKTLISKIPIQAVH